VEHVVIDWILGVGTIAASLACVFIAIYLPRRLARRDTEHEGQRTEIARQGDRINRHTTEIRHLQQKGGWPPFDQNWDR
jgi:hypothetical protein